MMKVRLRRYDDRTDEFECDDVYYTTDIDTLIRRLQDEEVIGSHIIIKEEGKHYIEVDPDFGDTVIHLFFDYIG